MSSTMDASIRAFESRVMAAMEEVNERVTDLVATQGRMFMSSVVHARHAWSRSEDRSTALKANIKTLEAQVRTLQTQHNRIEWQRQQTSDMVTSAFGRIHALEARDRAHPNDLEDTDSSY
ncbi:hypothetical protein Tco_0324922 [Tanacetum coccineum]